jgi:hypothetical protein
MKYTEYLRSDHWKGLRQKKRKNGARCGICAATENIDTHHLLYKNLFDVETSDLRLLCRRCHFLTHDLMRAGKIRFPSTSHHSRFVILKAAVKKHLGIQTKNMFYPKKLSA